MRDFEKPGSREARKREEDEKAQRAEERIAVKTAEKARKEDDKAERAVEKMAQKAAETAKK